MKLQNLFSLALFLLFTYSLQAQVSLGGKAGVHFSKWDKKPFLETGEGELKANLAFQTGFVANFGITKKLSFQTELYFIQKGVKFIDENRFTGALLSDRLILNHLELPMLFKLDFNSSENGPIVYGMTGLSIGYAISGKMVSEEIVNDEKTKRVRKIDFDRNNINRTELSIPLGIGIKIPSNSGYFSVDFRYLLGLSDVNQASVKHRGMGLALGYSVFINGDNNSKPKENL